MQLAMMRTSNISSTDHQDDLLFVFKCYEVHALCGMVAATVRAMSRLASKRDSERQRNTRIGMRAVVSRQRWAAQ